MSGTEDVEISKPILYSHFGSSASWRVRIALALKGINYEYRAVDIIKGEQFWEEFLQKNPMGQVPAFHVEGTTLTQSLPIIEYLEESYPGTSLLPKDPINRAQARSIAEMINSGIQPIQSIPIVKMVAEYSGKDEDKEKWAQYYIKKGFVALEKVLNETSGTYCVGDQVTIADLVLVPQVSNAKDRFNIDMKEFPLISKIEGNLLELEAFKKADPVNTPDCPK